MKIDTVTVRESMSMALHSIRAHQFRSALTVLGIVIGVATVIAIASILTGLRDNLVKLIEEYGTDNIYAFHLSTGFGPNRNREEWTRKPLTENDAVAVREGAGAVQDVELVAFSNGPDSTLTKRRDTSQ